MSKNKKPINLNPTKEFFMVLRSLEKITKNQAKILSYDPDDITSFTIEISPKDGIYQHAKFVFQIQLNDYPRIFPYVSCLSDIYHPNIQQGEHDHSVCLNLFDVWNKSFGLVDVIQGLIFLFYQPNLKDPISSLFTRDDIDDELFKVNVDKSLHGGLVNGVRFLPNPGIMEYEQKLNNKDIDKKIDSIEYNSEENETIEDLFYPISSDFEDKHTECEIVDGSTVNHFTQMENNNNATECHDDEFNWNLDILHGDGDKKSDENETGDKFEQEYDINKDNEEEVDVEGEEEIKEDEAECKKEEEDDKEALDPLVSDDAYYADYIVSRYYRNPDDTSDDDDDDEIAPCFLSEDIFETDDDFDCSDDLESAISCISFTFDDQNIDRYLSHIFSNGTSANDEVQVFVSSWLEYRQSNGISQPNFVTHIIRTNTYNPKQLSYCTFLYQRECICRVEHFNIRIHMSIWLMNSFGYLSRLLNDCRNTSILESSWFERATYCAIALLSRGYITFKLSNATVTELGNGAINRRVLSLFLNC